MVPGHREWTGIEDGWLGGNAPMWWSHTDAATYRAWIEQAGLSVLTQEVVPEGDGVHALFWARLPWGDDLERTEPILRRIEQGPPHI